MTKDDYETLLDTFSKLHKRNEEKKKLGVHDYSLMNALLKKTDEVNLHSNFIYSMINPNSSHYCEHKFLELFLESIEEENFIDFKNARVHKEKGKIDLLIEDGENILIIENKLRAVDQQHQISRYIQYVFNTYLKGDQSICAHDIQNRIRIVYLSQYKKIPENGNSIIGFVIKPNKADATPKKLIWQNDDQELCNGTKLSLPKDTKLKFSWIQHSNQLLKWVEQSKSWLDQNRTNSNSRGLIYAFDEYELILTRLDTQKRKQWRNLMNVDEYTLGLKEQEQKEMYTFMRESQKYIKAYSGKKLYNEIDTLFNNITRLKIAGTNEFSEENCIKWFKRSGNKKEYINIAFECEFENKNYIFILATQYIYFGEKQTNLYDKLNRLKNTYKSNIYSIIAEIEKKKNDLGISTKKVI